MPSLPSISSELRNAGPQTIYSIRHSFRVVDEAIEGVTIKMHSFGESLLRVQNYELYLNYSAVTANFLN